MARNLEKDSSFETADCSNEGRATYRRRLDIIEPVFANITDVDRQRTISLRGKEALKEKAMHA